MDKSEQEILQRRMAQFLVTDVFNTISEQDVLKELPNGQWSHKGQPLVQGQIDLLKREAKSFSKMNLCELLSAELRWHARVGLNEAKTEADIISAKLLSYFVDVFFSKIRKLETL